MAWTKEILFVKETSSFVPLCLKNLPDKVIYIILYLNEAKKDQTSTEKKRVFP